ncbi:7-carboxy-7-deazaguanine synthase QueE [Pseudoteredinibacter isoporae]|uniref:7-carboxy-7-deazaguanine synthase n=1 Tax=Pseudoteredinibacter isoporae TaxID=570281 RepID=A0A7X0MYB3_9GAMM|nr:7-carboxy-7-deazaguanine synthase QueE [Pseudoteredinibacter isoporae]MBB6522889.1 7-carboxy-7-deazaguanine synthase [Pseudoteredinibacter isoporae]NHO88415.1 7-carboxy-7-deazaguanine synthase QueE [Pseudoteredinibacter isoporae]NIB23254.1 7-carboxy-7-deazaguanine synthase QueE [Pseudoteredinibacter isoporae]
MDSKQLRITEIFHSLQGEAISAGLRTVFVRLTGCPLRCNYCDSEYAFFGGEKMSLKAIVEKVTSYDAEHVCVTGGEPLSQPNCLPLLSALCDEGFAVSLETSGAMPIDSVDSRVSRVMDLKTPDSGEAHRNRYENIELLNQHDQLKFVICSRADYEWARFKLEEYNLTQRVAEVLFSASHEELPHRDLADWIVADRLPVRFQMQLHKILWGDQPGF